ncbi:hypothetical protein PIECOFPK_00437 [Mycovorax composti]|uniref:Phospholipase n=1 Tax=Mycovorax composti TaxID=2962693 RepID=A0ABZ2EHR0_9BACT
MKKIALLLVLPCLLLSWTGLQAQQFELFEKHSFVQGSDTLPYRVLLPENYDASKKYPLVLFLHGAGERGSDNEKQLTHGAALFLQKENRSQFPAIVVFPQCSRASFWSNVKISSDENGRRFDFEDGGTPTVAMKLVMGLLEQLMVQYPIQKKQVYVMGLSMGGMGTFELVNRKPDLFAAAVPICGGANPIIAKNLKSVKWWVFHGAKDDVVPPKYSEAMVTAMKSQKVDVKFTLYPETNHNSWDATFAEPELLPWLFSCKRK